MMCVGPAIISQLKQKYSDRMNLSFWNVHGQKSKTIGDKFLDKYFLKEISSSYILGLVELHTESVANIPGFQFIKQII